MKEKNPCLMADMTEKSSFWTKLQGKSILYLSFEAMH